MSTSLFSTPSHLPHRPHNSPSDSAYGYLPTFYVCVIFIVLFSLSTTLHLGQAIYTRKWYLIPTMVLGGLGEVIGWGGRLWSNKNVFLFDPYLMQISCTILAPTFMSAANFIILGQIINRVGFQYSRLSAKAYAFVFITTDIAALIVQAIGGASASTAAQNFRNPEKGGKIMLGGIVIQMAAIAIYVALAAEFVWRFNTNRPIKRKNADNVQSPTGGSGSQIRALPTKLQLMILGLGISSLFLFIRAIYRTIELADGWNGPVISNQTLFNVLDGMPITIVMWTMNFFHPGWLLVETPSDKATLEGKNSVEEGSMTPVSPDEGNEKV